MTSTYPLPEGWSEPELFEDVVVADGVRLCRVGLASQMDGAEAIGSAADGESSPFARAQFELLERVAVLEASRRGGATFPTRSPTGEKLCDVAAEQAFPISPKPDIWTYARSNGVALHTDWTRACESARLELVERERVLRAWLGDTEPVAISLREGWDSPLSRTTAYEWCAFLFPALASGDLAPEAQTVGLFGFPFRPDAPLVFGYGARAVVGGPAGALAAASREAMQLLSFLWGEPVSTRPPPPTPTPMCHLETYQCRERHGALRSWLAGGHRRYRRADALRSEAVGVSFVDLTPAWLAGAVHVVKAICPAALPLAFGPSPVTAHLPAALQLHPIP